MVRHLRRTVGALEITWSKADTRPRLAASPALRPLSRPTFALRRIAALANVVRAVPFSTPRTRRREMGRQIPEAARPLGAASAMGPTAMATASVARTGAGPADTLASLYAGPLAIGPTGPAVNRRPVNRLRPTALAEVSLAVAATRRRPFSARRRATLLRRVDRHDDRSVLRLVEGALRRHQAVVPSLSRRTRQ